VTRQSIVEYAEAVRGRYVRTSREVKAKILDEFVQATGPPRKGGSNSPISTRLYGGPFGIAHHVGLKLGTPCRRKLGYRSFPLESDETSRLIAGMNCFFSNRSSESFLNGWPLPNTSRDSRQLLPPSKRSCQGWSYQ
jgi:hypothetical protein